jgi:Skp family chaperone for outer membrane proteins
MMLVAVSFAILFLLTTMAPASAQNSYSEFERGLQLSDPQRAQVEDIRNRYINDWQNMRRESARKRMELRELSRDPSANAARIGRLQGELRDLDTARHNSYRQYRSEVSRTLNDRQKHQYNTFCDQERRNRMRERSFGPGRHGR